MELKYKCTMWCRLTIPDDVKKEDVIKVLNEGMLPLEVAFDKHIPNMENAEWEVINDTEEFMSPSENNEQSTIEFIDDNNKCIWDNSFESELLRKEKSGNKIFTMLDAINLKTDIDVLALPKRIYCDEKETLHMIQKKLSDCHIGTVVNYYKLFIQS